VTPMEPIPETVEAIDGLDPSADDGSLLADLIRSASRGQAVVPDLVGVSIAGFDHGLTFTLVATEEEVAVLDAFQYLAGGPCVEAAHTNQVMAFVPDVFEEERWRFFAEATAACAVRSTLTLPVLNDGRRCESRLPAHRATPPRSLVPWRGPSSPNVARNTNARYGR
jgi:hypothetical protein